MIDHMVAIQTDSNSMVWKPFGSSLDVKRPNRAASIPCHAAWTLATDFIVLDTFAIAK